MGLCIGIAICQQNYNSAEAILADTSMAVRMARRSSSNAYRFIDAESRDMARDSYRFESDFREAVEAKSLEPFLQPIVDLASGEPVGFEALARWPRQGIVLTPDRFLPLAIESGLTGELDLLIVEKTLAALPLLAQPIPQRQMTISLNLSAVLLEDKDLRTRLINLIEDSPRPTGWTLQLELLEEIFQDTSEDFSQFLDALVERDVRIAIDDFGTGYSSLARLISLPIQTVKIDRAFVSQLDQQEDSRHTLLRTMLTMLNDLGLKITAEGVETTYQQQFLLAHGAGTAQGYLFAQPMPISDAIAQLQKLNYRPRALPLDRRHLRAARRRRLNPLLRWPFAGGRRSGD